MSLRACTSAAWIMAAATSQSTPAIAHPHTYIQVDAALLIDGGALNGLRYVWRFDRTYLDGLLQEFDANRDGLLTEEELQVWLAASVKNLDAFAFFMFLRQGATKLPLGKARDYRVERSNDGLALHFTVSLARPAMTKAGPIQIEIYDRTFFTEFVLGEGRSLTIEGGSAATCTVTVAIAPGGEQQKAITAFMKMFGRVDAKLSPAKAITVACKD